MKRADIPASEIIAAVDAFSNALERHDYSNLRTPEVALAGKYPEKLVFARMQQLVDANVLEVGTSLRTAWVIRYGTGWEERLAEAIRKWG